MRGLLLLRRRLRVQLAPVPGLAVGLGVEPGRITLLLGVVAVLIVVKKR